MPTSYEIGSFRLDTGSNILYRGSEPLALGKRAVSLLRTLVERAGTPVSKGALIEATWPDMVVEESNLSVQISALRRVFEEEPGGERWIETLPRRGYRFVGPVEARESQEDAALPSATARVQRRLSAIMVSDVVDYSRVTNADERGDALSRLRTDIFDPIVSDHHGRVVKRMGDDGAVVEFASVVDAGNCALRIQRSIAERHGTTLETLPIALRIGVHLGDVIIHGEDISGDGVNIASRLRDLANPSGTVISGMVYEIVRGKVSCKVDDLGTQKVEDFGEPIHAFQISQSSEASDLATSLSATLPAPPAVTDRPSIVVLPFKNSGDDPEQQYFADGVTEDLITDLSKVPGLFVVARHSAFSFKDAPNPQDAAHRLGVGHVLSGSVRRSGNRVRINAELAAPETGELLWADRFDGDLADIFALQDDINSRIVSSLKSVLAVSNNGETGPKSFPDPKAYDLCLRGRSEFYLYAPDHLAKAKGYFEQAIEIDPNYAEAYSYLSYCRCTQYVFAWPGCDDTLEPALKLAERAIDLDQSSAVAYCRLGWIQALLSRRKDAMESFERAIALNPQSAEALFAYGDSMNRLGDPQRALPLLEKAFSIDTFVPPAWDAAKGHSFNLLGRYEEAVSQILPVLERVPGFIPGRVQLARAYSEMGRTVEAKAAIKTLLEIAPNYDLKCAERAFPYTDKADRDKLLDLLRAAGLPD